MLEVEGEDGKSVALGERHDAAVDETQIEVGESIVDLDGPPQDPSRGENDRMLSGRDGPEERPRGTAADPCAKKLVDLGEHRAGHEQVASQLRDERCRKLMRPVAAVGGCNQRTGIRDDFQRAATSSRRYRSANRPRSSGPSPEPT
jgi:hypothetical protein